MNAPRLIRWTTLALGFSLLTACATAPVSGSSVTGWPSRAALDVNPHLRLLEAQTRGATERSCVPGPVWSSDVPKERRLQPRIEILEFTDLECPYCFRVQATIERVLQHYGPCTVRVTTVPKPLPMHPGARDGALLAARAAQSGGERFERVQRLLFEAEERLDRETLKRLATEAGMTEDAVVRSLADPDLASFVDWGVFVGDQGGARGTPTFFVNGRLLSGNRPFESFAELIDAELQLSQGREGRWGDRWLAGRLALNAPVVYALMLEGRRLKEMPEAEEEERSAAEAPSAPNELEVREVEVREGDPILGKPSAPVTIVTFTDFECPYCVRLHRSLQEIVQAYGDSVRLVAKQFPLTFHPNARAAAKAALCAQEQGAYWAFHDALFDQEARLQPELYRALAKKLKLNLKKFKRCNSAEASDRRIDADMAQAAELGVRGTPVSFVNGFKVLGAMPASHFKALIEAALGPEAGR